MDIRLEFGSLEGSAWESMGNIGYNDSTMENEDIVEQEVCQARTKNWDPNA
jgi:hypothetical protein